MLNIFNWFKKNYSTNKETEKTNEVFLETLFRNYTKKEIENYLIEFESFDKGSLCLSLRDLEYIKSSFKTNVIGHIHYISERIVKTAIEIDLYKHDVNYYMNICKTINFLDRKCDITIFQETKNIRLHCGDYTSFLYNNRFNDISNFTNDNSFAKYVTNKDIVSPKTFIDIKLGEYNEEELNSNLKLLENMKNEYNEYMYKDIIRIIDFHIDQFPEEFFELEITNNSEKECMYTLNAPKQEITGSYRITDVLFRGDFFVLVPAVMYKIQTKKKTKKDIIKMLIECCNNDVMIIELNKHFGV